MKYLLAFLSIFALFPQCPGAESSGPVLAPYVQAISPQTNVIQWDTSQPAYGWVEYGEVGTPGRAQDAVVHGLRQANVSHHRIVLGDLRGGTRYWYRVHAKPVLTFAPYRVEFGPEEISEQRVFATLPGPRQGITTVIFNDLHNSVPLFETMAEAVRGVPFDFSIFNGDCLADPQDESKALAGLEAFNRGVEASSKPAFFVRGNHETRGAFARGLPEFLAWPGGLPYYAFTAGPVRFLVLDCGEDKSDDHKEYSGLVDFTSFRQQETEWLKAEVASRPFRKATWRVLVVHIPLQPTTKNGGNSAPCLELWKPLLAKAKIDLGLHAHLHRAAFHPANTVGNPYPFYIGGGNRQTNATVMVLQADNRELRLKVLGHDGREALPGFFKKR